MNITTITAAAAITAAAVIAPAAAAQAAPAWAGAIVTTYCTHAAFWTEYQACVTVSAAGTHVNWVQGSFRVYPNGTFSGRGTVTLGGFYAQTGPIAVAYPANPVHRKTSAVNVHENISAGTRVCATLRTRGGRIVSQWCGPESWFGRGGGR